MKVVKHSISDDITLLEITKTSPSLIVTLLYSTIFFSSSKKQNLPSFFSDVNGITVKFIAILDIIL